ncbi:MAG TPA: peptidoglycan DD-metalloendopeptidase family protein [Pseudidiomarina sp.]|nr:peptidoglycan DD-metalloendopeptidase family protein [Pseudidiomarina sp.]
MITLCAWVLVACAQRDAAAPVKRVYTGSSIHDYERASLSAPTYTVIRGDTLYSIAFRANLDVRELARLNALADPYVIYPGQVLNLKSRRQTKTSTAGKRAQKSVRSTPKTSTKTVDSPVNREYVDVKNKQNISKPKVLPTPLEVLPASKDIVWRWPSSAQVIREFSTAEAGNKGLDFGGARDDPVFAAAAGKVVYAGNALKGYGNLIILKHNDDYITAYAHNSKLLVTEQQWVQVGDEIARMGDTDAERVKLHFEVRFRGKSVNPRHYLPRGAQ